MSETLSVRLVGGAYEIRRTFSMPGGQATLIAHVRPDGTVIDANSTGSLPFPGGADQLQHTSMLTARTLPERLILGRQFRPGDNLYADIDPQELVAGMMGAMATPPSFQLQATGTIPFNGTTGDGPQRSLNFAGPIHVVGNGVVNGQALTLESSGHVSIAIDATTGLMRGTTTESTMELKVNGVTRTEMQMRQSVTCTILPAA